MSGPFHACSVLNIWSTCSVCEGRLHRSECTTRRVAMKDCCEARHKVLHSMGIESGIFAHDLPMYDVERPQWATGKR